MLKVLRRIYKLLRFVVLLSLALVAGAVAVLTLTGKGRENLAGLISTMVSSPGSGVQVTGISGIWSGPLRIDSVVLSDADGAWLAARGIAVEWSPLKLMSSSFKASLLHADRVEVARLPESQEQSSKGGGLPVSLDIDRLDLPQIALGPSLAGEIAQVSADGSLQVDAEPLKVRTDLKIARTDGRQGTLDAKIVFAPDENQLAVDVHGSEPAGGIIANLLQLPDAPPVDISVSGTGPAENWNITGTFSVAGQIVTEVTGKRQLTEKGNRIEAKGQGDFGRFLPEAFRPLIAGQTRFDFAGTIGDAGAVDVEAASLQSPSLIATAKGVIDTSAASDFALEVAARGAPASLTFGEGDGAVTITVTQASLRAFGSGETPALDLSATIERVVSSQAELGGVKAKLHSDSFDISNLAGPLNLSATAESGGSINDTVAKLLAGTLKIDAVATLSGDGVIIDSGTIVTGTVNAAVSGEVSLAEGSLKLDVDAELLSALLPEAVRSQLADSVNVTATLNRDAAGTIRLEPFAAKSGDIDAAGTIAYAPDLIDADLKGSFADISKLSPEIAGSADFTARATGAPAAPDVAATVTSDKLTALGREITGVSISASGKFDADNPVANVGVKGTLAGQALAAEGALKTEGGSRRIEGLLLTLGENRISGDLMLDGALVPEGTLKLSLPDIGPLASLVPDPVDGEVTGTVRFSRVDGVPQIAVDANAASIVRGDVTVRNAQVTALVGNYLLAPTIIGKVKALSITSGTTSIANVDLSLTRDGAWTGFAGGATVNGIAALATGRLSLAGGTTTIELAEGSAKGQGLDAVIAPTTITLKESAGPSAGTELAVEMTSREVPARLSFGADADAVAITIRQASLRAFGPAEATMVDASASLEKITSPQAELNGVEAKLHSDGFDLNNLAGPVTVSVTAQSGGSADETIAGLLAGALKIDVAATLAQDSARIDKGTIATDTVSAAIAGDISLADGSLKLDTTAELPSALLPPAARQYLAEKVSVTTTLNRDAAGTILLDPFTAKSGAVDVAGSTSYRSDPFDVRLTGNFADISTLLAGIAGPITFDVSAAGSPATPDISARISSEKLTAVGREITGLSLTASGKFDAANPAAKVSVKGNVAGEALTGEALLATSGDQRRIDGLSLAIGANKISGGLVLDEALVPQGTLNLVLPDIGPLASLANEQAEGEVTGTVSLSKTDGIPQIALDAKAASIVRGDLSVRDAEINAVVANYLLAPAISGKVKALSVTSGTTSIANVDLSLTRDGPWTGFSGGATVNDIAASATGRLNISDGTTTVELASGSAKGSSLNAAFAPMTITIKDGAGPSVGTDLAVEMTTQEVPARLSFGADAVAITIRQASLHAFGPIEAPMVDASASLEKITSPQAELSGVEAKLHSDGFDLGNRSGPLTLSVTAESGGSVDETIAGLLAGALKVDVAAMLAQDSARIDKGTIATGTLSAAIAGDVSLADGSLELDITADLLSALLPEAAREQLAEKVNVTATVIRDAAGAIRLDPFAAKSGPIDVAGSVAYATEVLDAKIKGSFEDISKLSADTAGSIGFEISATGSPSAPDVSATIFSDKFTAAGREITGLVFTASGKVDPANPAASVTVKGNVAGEALAGRAVLKTVDGERRIDGLSLTLGPNTISGNLKLDDAFVPEGDLALDLPKIGPLAALALDKAEGAINGTVSFSRNEGIPQVVVNAKAASLVRGDLSVKDAEVSAVIANYLLAPAVSGKVKAFSFISGTTSITNVDLSLTRDGAWTGFSGGATVNDIEASASGRLNIAAGVTTVELASGSAKTRGITATLARATTVIVKDNGATLDRLTLGIGGGTVQVTGTAAQKLNLDIQIAALPASVINAFASTLSATGEISGSARISGAAEKPNIGYTLDWKGATTVQTRDAGFGAMNVASSGTFEAGKLKFTANVGDGSGLGLKGGGWVETEGGRALSLDFSGQVPFGFLTSRLAAQGLALSGTSNVSLAVRGSIGSPVVSGSVTSSGARLVDARSGLAVEGINADIAIASGVATIRRLDGKLSSRGSLSASGTVGIDAATGFPANLAIKLVDARYTDGRIVTTNLSGDLALKGPLTGQPLLSGTINLAKTVITVPDQLPASISTLNVKHKNAPAAVRQQSAAIRPATSSGNSGSGLTLDMTVNAPQEIYVRGRGLEAELGGSIRLTGPLSSPQAVGQFELRRGRLTVLSRRLGFTRGNLSFSGSLIPTLDLAAESVASDATVTIAVIGLATNPKFNFSSSPALPQDEVLARLVFGRSLSNLSPLQIAQLAEAAAQLAGGGGTSLLETLRSRIGVDDLDLKTDEKGGTSVSAGKYLNDRTYVTIEKGDKAGSGKVTIDLDVGRGIKLRGEAGEAGAKGGIFYEREY